MTSVSDEQGTDPQAEVQARYEQEVQRELGAHRHDLIMLRIQAAMLTSQRDELVRMLTQERELTAGLRERVQRSEAAGREVAEQLQVARRGTSGVRGEILIGEVDGVNRVFRTSCPVRPGTMVLCTPHTILMEVAAGGEGPGDYMVSGDQVTFRSAPPGGQRLMANYQRARARKGS